MGDIERRCEGEGLNQIVCQEDDAARTVFDQQWHEP